MPRSSEAKEGVLTEAKPRPELSKPVVALGPVESYAPYVPAYTCEPVVADLPSGKIDYVEGESNKKRVEIPAYTVVESTVEFSSFDIYTDYDRHEDVLLKDEFHIHGLVCDLPPELQLAAAEVFRAVIEAAKEGRGEALARAVKATQHGFTVAKVSTKARIDTLSPEEKERRRELWRRMKANERPNAAIKEVGSPVGEGLDEPPAPLTAAEHASLKEHTERYPWQGRDTGKNAVAFISQVYVDWLKRGFALQELRSCGKAARDLAAAYAMAISRDPSKAIPSLYIAPRRKPPGTPLPTPSLRVADLTPEQAARRRAAAAVRATAHRRKTDVVR